MAFGHLWGMTVEDYLKFDESNLNVCFEYIDGRLKMLPCGTRAHALISGNMYMTLRGLLRGSSCRVFNSDIRIKLSQTRYVYPDVTVSCHEQDRPDEGITVEHPILIVEVLSAMTEAYDRGEKFELYQECPEIQEYVLVNTRYPRLDIYRREKQNLWTLRVYKLGDTVKLSSLGIEFPVSAVYEDIAFPSDERDGETTD